MRNAILVVAIVGMLLLAGCAALEGNKNVNAGGYDKEGFMPPAVSGASPMIAIRANEEAGFAAARAPDQKMIKSAFAEVEVPAGALQDKVDKFKGEIASKGGQILSADYQESESRKEYNIQLKLPPQKFEELAMMLQGVGSVKSMNSNVEDVGDQYVDLETRIRNLEIQRARLQGLFDRNGTLEDVLSVERELTRVQTEIEMYRNRKLGMDRRIAMSSVQVRIYEQAPAVDRKVLDPLSGVANVFLGALSFAIIALSALAGFGIPMLAGIGLVYLAYRRFVKKEDAARKGGKN